MIHGQRFCYWGAKKVALLQQYMNGEALIMVLSNRAFETVPYRELSWR